MHKVNIRPLHRFCCQTTITMKSDLKTLIAPSLLSCDLARIAEDATNMLELGADWLVRA